MSVFQREYKKTRNKRWHVSFRYNRKRYRLISPENSAAGAKAYEALLRQKLVRGEAINAIDEKLIGESANLAFRDFSKQWLESYVKVNNKYSEELNKICILNAHLLPYFGDMPLSSIKTLDVEKFKALKMKSLANKSINNLLITLNKSLKTAEDWELLDRVPKIKLLKVTPQKFDFLKDEECHQLRDGCEGQLLEMVIVAMQTGLRFGELIALEWQDINFEHGIMTVRRSITRGRVGSTKSNKIREIPLSNEVYSILRAKNQRAGYIFTDGCGKQLYIEKCGRWLRRACAKTGLRKIGWHSLRHTFASQLAQRNVPIISIKELLGHSDIKTTMRYSHTTIETSRNAIAVLNSPSGHQSGHSFNESLEKLTLAIPKEAHILNLSQ